MLKLKNITVVRVAVIASDNPAAGVVLAPPADEDIRTKSRAALMVQNIGSQAIEVFIDADATLGEGWKLAAGESIALCEADEICNDIIRARSTTTDPGALQIIYNETPQA